MLLESIARDKPRRITHPKQVAQLQELRKQGRVTFTQKMIEGRPVLYDIMILKVSEVPMATPADFYKPRSQALL